LIEFALLLPLLFLLIANLVNFGAYLNAWITVANAARAGVQYMVLAGASVGGPAPPEALEITAVVTVDISALINRASLQVRACTNNNGTVTCSGTGGGGSPPSDPEPLFYVLAAVDVTYTYQPLIPVWSFPRLGIYLTLPSSTIHRSGTMRMLQ
jgi:Flp pilus assembly protein TadG